MKSLASRDFEKFKVVELDRIWHNDPMAKKKEIYFGKGFKRIYFVLAGIWLAGVFYVTFLSPVTSEYSMAYNVKWFFISTALPFVLYFILLFFIKGFKK